MVRAASKPDTKQRISKPKELRDSRKRLKSNLAAFCGSVTKSLLINDVNKAAEGSSLTDAALLSSGQISKSMRTCDDLRLHEKNRESIIHATIDSTLVKHVSISDSLKG